MSGHTPGPWRAYPESSREWCVEAESKGIACTDTEADARLIAASPEFYEAATNALDFFDKYFADLDVPPADLDGVYKALDAAIAKAEGRS